MIIQISKRVSHCIVLVWPSRQIAVAPLLRARMYFTMTHSSQTRYGLDAIPPASRANVNVAFEEFGYVAGGSYPRVHL